MSKVNGKSRDKKKKKPCGDGYKAVKQEVKGSDKSKIKCVKIKKRRSGIREKEDGPKGRTKDLQKERTVLPHEKQHSRFKKPPSGIRKKEE